MVSQVSPGVKSAPGRAWGPQAMTVHSGFVFHPETFAPVLPGEFLSWSASYVGATPEEGPGAWIWLRDAEQSAAYPCLAYAGDFSFFIRNLLIIYN